MCTLTWSARAGECFVAFSRDERRTRALGLGPRAIERGGVRAIAPIDGEAGGTWIAVNELGVTLALLNGYRFQSAREMEPHGGWRSRGEIVMSVCDAGSAADADHRLSHLSIARYRPFELVAFDADGAARISSWTGSELTTRTLGFADLPLVSSSFDDAGARAQRRLEFTRLVRSRGNIRELEAFHQSHGPSRGAYSPCMHREDAHTVSFTRVFVREDRVELDYQPQSPCAGMPAEHVELPRKLAART